MAQLHCQNCGSRKRVKPRVVERFLYEALESDGHVVLESGGLFIMGRRGSALRCALRHKSHVSERLPDDNVATRKSRLEFFDGCRLYGVDPVAGLLEYHNVDCKVNVGKFRKHLREPFANCAPSVDDIHSPNPGSH
jgi:hypothetical protein